MRTTQDRQQPTLGVLLLSNGNGNPGWLSDTLEPPMDGDANSPKGCIPQGCYKVTVTQSPKFGRLLPQLNLVPGFSGIRIHVGSRPEHTKGCILVPNRAAENYITNLIKSAQDEREETHIRVLDYPYYQTH